jgi:hypothetical protein
VPRKNHLTLGDKVGAISQTPYLGSFLTSAPGRPALAAGPKFGKQSNCEIKGNTSGYGVKSIGPAASARVRIESIRQLNRLSYNFRGNYDLI